LIDERASKRQKPEPFASRSLEKAILEYEALVSALQYTIGEREHLKALYYPLANLTTCDNPDMPHDVMGALFTSESERFQDIFALLLARKFNGGYFFKFDACYGKTASITYLLEKDFVWKGLLAEHARVWDEDLEENHLDEIDKRCVTTASEGTVVFHEGVDAKGSPADPRHRFLGRVQSSYEVDTVSLKCLLEDHKAPYNSDLISIDTEGGEFKILKNLHLSRHRLGVICVEQYDHHAQENDISALLSTTAYRPISPYSADKTKLSHVQVSGIDLFFLPDDSAYLIELV
jgi:FkbM family methyltransferase